MINHECTMYDKTSLKIEINISDVTAERVMKYSDADVYRWGGAVTDERHLSCLMSITHISVMYWTEEVMLMRPLIKLIRIH